MKKELFKVYLFDKALSIQCKKSNLILIKGNYSITKDIKIPGNSEFGGLTRFEAAVFRPLLEQMVNTRPIIGTISLDCNYIFKNIYMSHRLHLTV